MEDNFELGVYYHDKKVGTLTLNEDVILFSYSREWIQSGFSISPRSLPLQEYDPEWH